MDTPNSFAEPVSETTKGTLAADCAVSQCLPLVTMHPPSISVTNYHGPDIPRIVRRDIS